MYGHSGEYFWNLRSHEDLNHCFSIVSLFSAQGIMEHLVFAWAVEGRGRKRPDLCPLGNRGYCEKSRAVLVGGYQAESCLVAWALLAPQRSRGITSDYVTQTAGAVGLPSTRPVYRQCYQDLRTSWNRNCIVPHCSVHHKSAWEYY